MTLCPISILRFLFYPQRAGFIYTAVTLWPGALTQQLQRLKDIEGYLHRETNSDISQAENKVLFRVKGWPAPTV